MPPENEQKSQIIKRPYSYPECVNLIRRIAKDHAEFGYWEIDVAIAKTIEEMLAKKELVAVCGKTPSLRLKKQI